MGRRDLPVAVHAEDHGRGGVRLRLDPRGRGPGRRLRQARDRRLAQELADPRPGDPHRLGRGAPRGAPRRLHRRPALPLGERARHEPDLRLRRPHRPGEAAPRPDDRRLRPGVGRRGRAARLLRAARPDADRRPVERQGQDRPDGDRRVHERGAVHHDPLDAHRRRAARRRHREGGGRLRVRRAGPPAEERHVHDIVHRLVELHDGTSARWCRTRRP